MNAGHRAKSAKLKLLEGNAGHDSIRNLKKKADLEPEPELIDDIPEPPREIKPEGLKEWNHIVPSLIKSKVLAYHDLSFLATYCNIHAAIVRYEQIGETPPAALLTQYRMMAESFGLTPASRSKVNIIGEKEIKEKDIRKFIG